MLQIYAVLWRAELPGFASLFAIASSRRFLPTLAPLHIHRLPAFSRYIDMFFVLYHHRVGAENPTLDRLYIGLVRVD